MLAMLRRARSSLYSMLARGASYLVVGWISHVFETFGRRHGIVLLPKFDHRELQQDTHSSST